MIACGHWSHCPITPAYAGVFLWLPVVAGHRWGQQDKKKPRKAGQEFQTFHKESVLVSTLVKRLHSSHEIKVFRQRIKVDPRA